MPKWYKPSMSLAAKCRLGFAAAVLLIIGAALLVPYRWMDKLVEQGKREVAQAEVQYVLRHHFSIGDSLNVSPAPQLSLGSDYQLLNTSLPALETNNSETTEQPLTLWLPVPANALDQGKRDKDVELPGDEFEQSGIKTFLAHPGKNERFVLFMPRQTDTTQDSVGKLKETLGWGLPSRYLRAVRADSTCLAAGCHSIGTADDTQPEKNCRTASI